MPVEIIGDVGTPRADRKWISAEATLAIRHVVEICGESRPQYIIAHKAVRFTEAATVFFLVLRQALALYADKVLRIPRFHLRENIIRAMVAFFSVPEIKHQLVMSEQQSFFIAL